MSDNEGWIPHDGGKMPCDGDLLVAVKFRGGSISYACYARVWEWKHIRGSGDIIAWRPHKNADGQAGQEVAATP